MPAHRSASPTRYGSVRVFGGHNVLDGRNVEVAREHPVAWAEEPVERVHEVGKAAMLVLQFLDLPPLILGQERAK